MSASVHITAFYHFVPLEDEVLAGLHDDLLAGLHDDLRAFGQEHGMLGLTLLAAEGINGTVCGSPEAIRAWKKYLSDLFPSITFKDSGADGPVFKRWSVKRKEEIVGLKRPDIRPNGKHKHLSPAAWHAMLRQEDVVVIDARNDYEYDLGAFEGAVNPGIRSFKEFPDYVRAAGIPKDKKVLMYCTGGIRCEKALYAMEEQGYEEVYQLDGGILAYLEQFPEEAFRGECFVFDQRVAVDQHLRPSQTYDICPHCGLPGDQPVACASCGSAQHVCADCAKDERKRTCSKRCANELRMAVH